MPTLRKVLALLFTLAVSAATCFAATDELVAPHVRISWCAIDSAHAHALAETIATARQIYVDLGFNMPDTVYLSITCGMGGSNLFTDGNDQIFLSIPSLDALTPPGKSGVYNLYGVCHELGHIAMYRTLKSREWLTNDAAEGWAHYIGSVVVDRVFAEKGESLWPEPYDYRKDGTARLQQDIDSKSPTGMTMAAAEWQKLGRIIGLASFPHLFTAWEAANIDPVRPSKSVLEVTVNLQPKSKAMLAEWWTKAEPALMEKVEISQFPMDQIPPTQIGSLTLELPADTGTETSHASIGGGGEGRRFKRPDNGDWYIKAVSIYGSRYGGDSSDAKFDIALSDADGKLIYIGKGKYSTFDSGNDRWTRFEIPPVRVPPTFYTILNFRATGSNGIYVGWDASTKGDSVDSLPGKPLHVYGNGDWMIRVELVQKR